MRQIWISKTGAPEVLVVKEAPDPRPGAGEVRVRVEASGVNFAEVMGRLGLYPDLLMVGNRVDTSWIGRDVLAMTRFGGYADVVCAPKA